jgi:hypothetical protein
VQHLALGSSLAISGLALVGLAAHEVAHDRAAHAAKDRSDEGDAQLAAAA